MTQLSQHRRLSVRVNSTVNDITHATGISFEEELKLFRVAGEMPSLSIYHDADHVNKVTRGLIARVLAQNNITWCRPIGPASTFNSMCDNLNIGFSTFYRSFAAHSDTRLHYKLRVLKFPWEFDAVRKTIAELGAIVVLPAVDDPRDPFANFFSPKTGRVPTLADLQLRIFTIDRVRLMAMAPSRTILSKLEYPGTPLRKRATLGDLLARVNVSIGAVGSPDRGTELTVIQPNGEALYVTGETIADYRKLSLSHLRWP